MDISSCPESHTKNLFLPLARVQWILHFNEWIPKSSNNECILCADKYLLLPLQISHIDIIKKEIIPTNVLISLIQTQYNNYAVGIICVQLLLIIPPKELGQVNYRWINKNFMVSNHILIRAILKQQKNKINIEL